MPQEVRPQGRPLGKDRLGPSSGNDEGSLRALCLVGSESCFGVSVWQWWPGDLWEGSCREGLGEGNEDLEPSDGSAKGDRHHARCSGRWRL